MDAVGKQQGRGRARPGRRRAALLVAGILAGGAWGGGAWLGCSDRSAPEQACLDTLDALADAWERCGYDRDTKRAELLGALRNCERVEAVRDEAALRQQCFPALETLDCTALVEDDLPEPCLDQILF